VLFDRSGANIEQPERGPNPAPAPLSTDALNNQLEKILACPVFATSPQLCRFLQFVVAKEMEGRGDQLKEYAVAVEVFRRNASFDPRLDTVVRTEARRLRLKLAEYYQGPGNSDPIEISLPKGGYRPVFASRAAAVPQATSKAAPDPGRRNGILLAAACVLATALLAIWLMHALDPGRTPSIAVLPLDNLSADPEQEYFSDGMTDELITELAKIRGLRVISRTSILPFKRAKASLAEIARQLGVDYVVEGTVLRSGQRVRITAQLIAVRNEHHVWAESYERERGDVVALQGEVASAIVGQVNIRITAQDKARLMPHPVTPDAHESYLKGRFYWHTRKPDLVRQSVEHFNQAIEKQPGYALAYAGLGDAYQVMAGRTGGIRNELLERARSAAQTAIQLDDDLGEAHSCLGGIYVADWNWTEGEREYRRALELSPSYPTAHYWYGDLLGVLGRNTESLAQARSALDLDPLSPPANAFLGTALYNARQYGPAVRQLQQTIEAFPDMIVAYIYLALSYSGLSMHREAIETARRAMQLTGGDTDVVGLLGYVEAVAGHKEESQRLLNDLTKRNIDSPFILAGLYLDVGDRERALNWLEKGYADHAHLIELIGISHVFDALHGDPRFGALLKKMKLVS
jgi:TolB-like protein/Tfp pilus assembly protein PilF